MKNKQIRYLFSHLVHKDEESNSIFNVQTYFRMYFGSLDFRDASEKGEFDIFYDTQLSNVNTQFTAKLVGIYQIYALDFLSGHMSIFQYSSTETTLSHC